MRLSSYPMIKIKYIGEIAYNLPSLYEAYEKLEERFNNSNSPKVIKSLVSEMDRVEELMNHLELNKRNNNHV